MSCRTLSLREIELIEEISSLRTTLRALYATRDALSKLTLEQYSLDTGQVRQFGIYQRMTQINSTIDKVRREIQDLQSELDDLSGTGGGQATVVVPCF